MKHTVLGATGDIGSLLLSELTGRGLEVMALSRHLPKPDSQLAGVKYATVDAEDSQSLLNATKGIDVLYSTISVPYNTEAWRQFWPIITRNLIDASRENQFKLVFLDNVYMYGKVDGPMTENSPIHPASEKGKVRALVANMLLEAIKKGEINAAVGRSTDFYGPNSRISQRFFEGTLKEAKAYWLGRADVLRTWSYAADNARALAILGNDSRADQKVWHMPAAPAMKGTDFIALAERILNCKLQTILIPGSDPKARAAFAQNMPEIADMMYQYDSDYVFNSSRFQETFGMQPTPYEVGFKNVYDVLASRP